MPAKLALWTCLDELNRVLGFKFTFKKFPNLFDNFLDLYVLHE